MYRHLNSAERAPLPIIIKHVRKIRSRQSQSPMAVFHADQAVIKTLHQFGWRKSEYEDALSRCESRISGVEIFMSKRSIYPFM